MKLVVLDGEYVNSGDLSWEGLERFGALEVHDYTPREQVAQRMAGASAVFTNRVPLSGQVLKGCPDLGYIGLFATGYNHIDIEAAQKIGITVCNVPNYSTMGVAQHTVALLLEATNHVGAFSATVHAGAWRAGMAANPLSELWGKTFGAIGFGSIGRAAGRMAAALGMRVLACGSRPTEEGLAIAEYVELDTLLAQSDVVSLHCPLLPETQGIISRGTIAKMKPGAILLNTARGALVVEEDLADALKTGRIAAAGLDVTWPEPLAEGSPLRGAPNCFITPHVAWTAIETRRRLLEVVAENYRAFLAGTPQNVVGG